MVQLDGVLEMIDKELIELAAKAAGITGTWHRSGYVAYSGWGGSVFDPITSDGDALRLAVELRIDVSHDEVGMKSFVYARTVFNDEKHIGLSEIFDDESERLDRTRRAITRAAAKIGKEMK